MKWFKIFKTKKYSNKMNTLQFKIPKGFEVESFDKKTGEIKFKETPKKVTDRIKTITNVLEDNGLTQEQFTKSCTGLEVDEINYRLTKLLCKSLNEGWVPDWDNSNERKYTPWFKMGSGGFRYDDYVYWSANSSVGSRLCLKSDELAKYAGTQFTEVYEKFMITK